MVAGELRPDFFVPSVDGARDRVDATPPERTCMHKFGRDVALVLVLDILDSHDTLGPNLRQLNDLIEQHVDGWDTQLPLQLIDSIDIVLAQSVFSPAVFPAVDIVVHWLLVATVGDDRGAIDGY